MLRHPALSRRPGVSALGRAARREKVLALCGVALAVAGGCAALLLLGRHGPAGAGATPGPPTLPAVGRPLALGLIVIGAAFMDFGWPLYRLTVIASGAVLGAACLGVAGWSLAGPDGLATGAIVGAVIGGVAAWPVEVLVRTLSGCLAGALVGLAVGSLFGRGVPLFVGAGAGILAGGLLTFLAFRALMMTVYAITGAVLIVYGAMSLYASGQGGLVKPTPLALLAMAGLAAVGIITQHALAERVAAAKAREQQAEQKG